MIGLADGGMAYLSGKGDGRRPGLVSLLPSLNSDQLGFLTAAAAANLPDTLTPPRAAPQAVRHVALVLTDARGDSWKRLLREAAALPGYISARRGQLSQIAQLTSGLETDFFAKLGPSVDAGRLAASDLVAARRAAMPAAGTLWSNAAAAGLSAETYGIAGRRSPSAFVAKLREGDKLARLTVIRLAGTPEEQDGELGDMMSALGDHPASDSAVVFAVPTGGAPGAAVSGVTVHPGSAPAGPVSPASIVRTVSWLLGLRPMTQVDASAPVLDTLFRQVR